jgi:hypothetical protein
MRIAALALAATLIGLPAVAQSQGKSKTAPGHSTTNPAPGQTNDQRRMRLARCRKTLMIRRRNSRRVKVKRPRPNRRPQDDHTHVNGPANTGR